MLQFYRTREKFWLWHALPVGVGKAGRVGVFIVQRVVFPAIRWCVSSERPFKHFQAAQKWKQWPNTSLMRLRKTKCHSAKTVSWTYVYMYWSSFYVFTSAISVFVNDSRALKIILYYVQVLEMDADKNWYKAEQDDREGWIPRTYIDMKPYECVFIIPRLFWVFLNVLRHTIENRPTS